VRCHPQLKIIRVYKLLGWPNNSTKIINEKKRTQDRSLGTPLRTGKKPDNTPPALTHWDLSVRYDLMKPTADEEKSKKRSSLWHKRSWSTESNVLEKSRSTQYPGLSIHDIIRYVQYCYRIGNQVEKHPVHQQIPENWPFDHASEYPMPLTAQEKY
jgi:hypothetical protein